MLVSDTVQPESGLKRLPLQRTLTSEHLQMVRRVTRSLLAAAAPTLLASVHAQDGACGGAWRFPCDDTCNDGTVFYSPSAPLRTC